jgi:DNA invertase Pin-like site-specific DNA recombinase
MKDLLDTRKGKDLVGTLISDIVVKLLSYVAETERNNIRKRQAEGIAAMPVVDGKKYSTKKGCTYGRKAISLGDDFEKFLQKQKDGLMTVNECCEALGIGRTTWYARVREYSA